MQSEDIYKQDRFYVDTEADKIVWMYFNPDAVSGNQFVRNEFSYFALLEAIEECESEDDIFEYISENCRQYLSDIGSEDYETDFCMFNRTPLAIGMSVKTILSIMLMFLDKYRYYPIDREYRAKNWCEIYKQNL